MDTIVKFCSSCDEGFAKTIVLCPHCGSTLDAFRLTAIDDEPKGVSGPAATFTVTVLTQHHGTTRNVLFAGALVFLVAALVTGMVVSLFRKDLNLGSINNDIFNAVIVDNMREPIEKAPKAEKDTDKGGGDDDPVPASQGDRAPMRINPEFAPSVSMDRLTNPTIPIQMAIKGPINEKLDLSRYGVKLGGDTLSDGPGSDRGQGTGRNQGQGPGDGPGSGPGSNGGLSGRPGGGIPRGASDDEDPPPGRGLTIALKILSKPRPGYTDAARLNGVQGNVLLRVTFTASGAVGKIDVVKGLPDGLTERAIAAARKITFEPVMVNGKAITVTKQIEYAFYIY